MKKIALCLLSISLCSSIIVTPEVFSGQTFLYPKPSFASLGMHQSSWSAVAYGKTHEKGSALQATIFYDQSYHTEDAAAYFLFDKKNELNLSVGITSTDNTTAKSLYTPANDRDILGQWLGLTATSHAAYTGEYSVTPQQRQAGIIFEFSQDLKNLTDVDFLKHLYVFASLPVTLVENTLKYEGSDTILQAFTNQSIKATVTGQSATQNKWDYLRYPTETQSSLNLTCLKLGFGTTLVSEDDILIASNNTLIIPMTHSVENRTMFEPAQGYNGSIALASQALFQFPIMKSKNSDVTRICAYFGFENTVIIPSNSMRTFDLKDKPFSRYMLFYDKKTNSMDHGVNILTRECEVSAYNQINITTGIRINYYNAVGEIGYEFWAHGAEKLSLEKEWEEGRYGIAYINSDGTLMKEKITLLGLTASKSTINYVSFADGDAQTAKSHAVTSAGIAKATTKHEYNVYVKATDIDHNSAANQKCHVHRPYVSLGLRGSKENVDLFLNLGAYVSVVSQNSSTSTFGGWIKAGATF